MPRGTTAAKRLSSSALDKVDKARHELGRLEDVGPAAKLRIDARQELVQVGSHQSVRALDGIDMTAREEQANDNHGIRQKRRWDGKEHVVCGEALLLLGGCVCESDDEAVGKGEKGHDGNVVVDYLSLLLVTTLFLQMFTKGCA